MFEQHPVPQQISSYQFRLVGDMTLKQFFQLAAGCVVALIIYSTPLPGIFKWPLIVLFVVGGAAFAFLPLQDRPLAVWLLAFFKSIYGPTLYSWEKDKTKDYFLADNSTSAKVDTTIATPTQVVHPSDTAQINLEKHESSFLSKISEMVGLGGKTQITTPSTTTVGPTTPVTSPQVAETTPSLPLNPIGVKDDALSAQAIIDKNSQASRIGGINLAEPNKVNDTPLSVPTVSPIKIEKTQNTTNSPSLDEAKQVEKIDSGVWEATKNSPVASKTATFSTLAKPPAAPEYPNLIVGQVFDSTGRIIEGVVMEIKDSAGRAVRAFRSNQLGHFMTATPLPNGIYTLQAEKDGLDFTAVNITMEGKIIEPIAVWAEAKK